MIPFHINCSRECNFIFEAYFNSLVFMEVHQCTHVPLKIEKSFDKRGMLVNGCQCLFFPLFTSDRGNHFALFHTLILGFSINEYVQAFLYLRCGDPKEKPRKQKSRKSRLLSSTKEEENRIEL